MVKYFTCKYQIFSSKGLSESHNLTAKFCLALDVWHNLATLLTNTVTVENKVVGDVGNIQFPSPVDLPVVDDLHVCLHPVHVAHPVGQEQDRAPRLILEIRPHWGTTEPLRGPGMHRHGLSHAIHQ